MDRTYHKNNLVLCGTETRWGLFLPGYQSGQVWAKYKDWEERIMLSHQEGSEEKDIQLKRMHEIWVTRLATPHAGEWVIAGSVKVLESLMECTALRSFCHVRTRGYISSVFFFQFKVLSE
jgi:hypothetical protein